MVHKGVTTQWVGTAIDALQHPRRWNIWLLTRSQNSLALPSPYLAAAREPAGDFGQNKHTHTHRLRTQHFPTLKGACISCTLETSPPSLQGGHDGGAGGEEDRDSALKLRVTMLHLDGEDLTLSLFWGGLVSEGAPYDLVSASNMKQFTSCLSKSLLFYVAECHKFALRGFTICTSFILRPSIWVRKNSS